MKIHRWNIFEYGLILFEIYTLSVKDNFKLTIYTKLFQISTIIY